jgi:hypothetical protein
MNVGVIATHDGAGANRVDDSRCLFLIAPAISGTARKRHGTRSWGEKACARPRGFPGRAMVATGTERVGGPPVHPGGALDALLRGRDGGRVRAQSTELGAHGTANNSGENSDRTAVFSVSARSKVRISAENRDPVHDKISGKTAHTANPPVPSEMSGATPRRAAVPSAIMTPKRQDCVLRTAGEPAVRATKQCEARLRERSV